ncbi:nucleotidyltransferase family protein [Williamwhitmania taraxaci]|uniref:CBS domain-containing protein n=1 Tax=Williamwhitmania taraxaci TaxID=1640674 RepID=A0A1G6GGV2_9BACT|nr:nucleotidyltransferase family protein [Williamwhitmania taraxaci]SDB81180.1 CBS domain-containing protein [Williamwhitmania taraxaci]
MNTYRKHLLAKGSSIRQALERLNALAIDAIVFIVDEQNKLLGSLTDGDVRRGLLKGYTISNMVDDIVQPYPKFIRKGDHDIYKVIKFRDNNFRIIPILDENDCVVNVINFRLLKSYLPVDAVIMAGGRGERLKPLTDKTPKPLLKVGDKPILEHNLDRLSLYGIDDFWITVNYLGKQIEDYFENGQKKNIVIQYIYENEPLGTIGAVSKINNFCHDFILVANSDLLTNIDYEHFFLDFIKQDADFSVVTIPYAVDIPYAVLETNNGNVISFSEKPTYTYYSNGGIYLFKKEVLSRIPIEKHFNATDLMENLIQSGKRVISYPITGYWLDIGRPEDFNKAQRDIMAINFK